MCSARQRWGGQFARALHPRARPYQIMRASPEALTFGPVLLTSCQEPAGDRSAPACLLEGLTYCRALRSGVLGSCGSRHVWSGVCALASSGPGVSLLPQVRRVRRVLAPFSARRRLLRALSALLAIQFSEISGSHRSAPSRRALRERPPKHSHINYTASLAKSEKRYKPLKGTTIDSTESEGDLSAPRCTAREVRGNGRNGRARA